MATRWRMTMAHETLRLDLQVIVELIPPNTSVLDLGCGTGELLYMLIKEKNVRGQGIEIDEQAIYKCVAKGLNVFHGDIDQGLSDYEDEAFDYVILNQSLQQVHHLETVLMDALRVGKRIIVGFPNFVYYLARLQFFFLGRTPVTPALPYMWYESPNLHFLSISDFVNYCWAKNLTIERRVYLGKKRRIRFLPNLFANIGIFVITR
ncbi:methionine biosynthesis protein MetW [candidate division KSB3 bacterium]|uniref:Methionine biosynthesis protein MetW n=1 Tax=candidate division KSB3 bacterium TaxID=2044937 RepID=A0A9D5JSZ5_9BACT|nr:methionine biosynthesis protein MetW [candidate division KSB3 bacterium]MBD3323688.1 methionine biosynthesis protein MetW [candidate division KSB3 bacterium]